MNTMDMLFGALIVIAFVTFAVTLAVVSDQTERYLKGQGGKSRRR
jgi:hypothetical protein